MGPAPVRMTALTEASRRISSQTCTNSSTAVLPVSALRVSGWFMVRVQMAPSRAMFRKDMEKTP